MGEPLIKLADINLSFGSVEVLKGINLEIRPKEIIAVLGANGAGKSTLMNILSGKLPFYRGQITWEGKSVKFRKPKDTLTHGIVMVQQELGLIPDLTGMENIMLGQERSRFGIINRSASFAEASEALKRLANDVPLDIPVSALSPSRQQLIALARALRRRPKLLILDEPTSMITDADVEQLMRVLKDLRDQGVTIVFISHKFNEVYALADRAVVLRDGVVAGEAPTSELNDEKIITWMVGTPPAAYHAAIEGKSHKPYKTTTPLLEAKGLQGLHTDKFDLKINKGEIVGLIGLVGSGRSEIQRTLAGVSPIKSGTLRVDGVAVESHNVAAMMNLGILLLPEDRKTQGLFLDKSLGFNALIYNTDTYSQWGLLKRGAEYRAFEDAQKLNRTDVDEYWRPARTLSGGNQQRLMLGKTLLRGSKVLLLDELSAGVDVTTKINSLRRIQDLARRGMGILFASSQWSEVTDIADRVYVVAQGRILAEFAKGQATHADFMRIIVEATEQGQVSHG